MKLNFAIFAAIFLLFTLSENVMAYDGQVVGQINLIEGATTANGGFSFVVTLKNSPALCGNTNTSAYLLNTDTNYRVNASILLTAKSLGSTVTLSSNQDANGYCQIMAFNIQ
jgi:hypothetical protein